MKATLIFCFILLALIVGLNLNGYGPVFSDDGKKNANSGSLYPH